MIVADRLSTDLGKMHYGDKNVITIIAVIELSARNEEEPVSGHSVVVYADEERNSSEIGKIHLSLAYFDVLSYLNRPIREWERIDSLYRKNLSRSWSDKYDNTAQKTIHVHTPTYLFYVRYDP